MTNAEKYLKDGVDVEKIAREIDIILQNDVNIANAEQATIKYFNSTCKPTLTEDERAILKHLKGFYYIYRVSTGELEATNKEHTWCGYELYFDDDVFQFIKERRRILY